MSEPINCTNSELDTFLSALAEGCWPTDSLDTIPCSESRSNPIASKSYTSGSKTVHFRGFPSLRMCASSTAPHGGDLLTSWPAASPARTLAQPAKALESAGNGQDYGASLQGSLARYDHDSRSWRTAQYSLLGGLTEFLGTWPRWGTMRDGACWEQTMPGHLTEGTESGYWPTPRASVAGPDFAKIARCPGTGLSLSTVVAMWPTPTVACATGGQTSRSGKRKGELLLAGAVKTFPTPLVGGTGKSTHGQISGRFRDAMAEAFEKYPTPKGRDWKGQSQRGIHAPGDALPNIDRGDGKPIGGSLNPTWVEWLMGWPLTWTRMQAMEPTTWSAWLKAFQTEPTD